VAFASEVQMPLLETAILGNDVRIYFPELVNIYGCRIGDETTVGPFVEIQKGAVIGAKCKISSHAFICDGVTLEDEIFVGHGVIFTNDMWPRATGTDGKPKGPDDWQLSTTHVKRRASLGSGSTILAGLTIGEAAMVGAGSVVTKDIPDFAIVVGNPARVVGDSRVRDEGN
jgi:UDP-2-acetamido-3-amino-2,3-dideoxy-glucuronate N-acetyltransferase